MPVIAIELKTEKWREKLAVVLLWTGCKKILTGLGTHTFDGWNLVWPSLFLVSLLLFIALYTSLFPFFCPPNSTTKPTDYCSGWIPSSRSHNIIIPAVGGQGSDWRMLADWIHVCQAYIFASPPAQHRWPLITSAVVTGRVPLLSQRRKLTGRRGIWRAEIRTRRCLVQILGAAGE